MLVGYKRSHSSRDKLTVLPHLSDENYFALVLIQDEGGEVIKANQRISKRHGAQRFLPAAQAFTVEHFQSPVDHHIHRHDQIAGDMHLHGLPFFGNRKQKRSIKSFGSIMERLPAAKIIERS